MSTAELFAATTSRPASTAWTRLAPKLRVVAEIAAVATIALVVIAAALALRLALTLGHVHLV